MRFFLDENIPKLLKSVFEKLSHVAEDVYATGFQGASDRAIARYAKNNRAILVTKDLEFGNLLLYPWESHYGLLILRVPNNFTSSQIAALVENFLQNCQPESLARAITILEVGRFRTRRFKN